MGGCSSSRHLVYVHPRFFSLPGDDQAEEYILHPVGFNPPPAMSLGKDSKRTCCGILRYGRNQVSTEWEENEQLLSSRHLGSQSLYEQQRI